MQINVNMERLDHIDSVCNTGASRHEHMHFNVSIINRRRLRLTHSLEDTHEIIIYVDSCARVCDWAYVRTKI
jgi:hypothetical protein